MSCAVVFCTSRTTKGGVRVPELSFHTFPKCPEVRNSWIKAIRRKNWEPTKYSRLCSRHFNESCFVSGLKLRKLKSDAVPTIFEGYPKYYQPVVKKRKISQELGCSNETRTNGTTPIFGTTQVFKLDDNTLKDRRLLETIEKVQAISVRRLKKIKVLRESNRRALKKIASLKNIVKDLKNKQLIEAEIVGIFGV